MTTSAKFIKYSITGNASGVWVMLLAPFLGMPLPFLPIQILWINLLADGVLALALSVEPAERNTMQRSPYSPTENVFSRGVGKDIVWVGLVLGLVIVAIGYWYWSTGSKQLANADLFSFGIQSDESSTGCSFRLRLSVSNRPFLEQATPGRGHPHIFGPVSGGLCPCAPGIISNHSANCSRVRRWSCWKYDGILGDRTSKVDTPPQNVH